MSSSNASIVSSSSTPPTTPSENDIPETFREFKIESPSNFASNFKQLCSHSRFNFWRPSYHLQAPRGWMNDPCAPGYNPVTELYHVSFQWNPYGNDWGNMSWLSATSPDMLHWTVDSNAVLIPDRAYDREGVFTGCLAKGNDGSMNYFYTSVTALPIHWTLPHPKGCEGLSMATSRDNGKTWTKSSSNPILSSEPEGLDVTGWRDPYVAQWPRMSSLLGLDEKTVFGIISGGVRNVSPTTFLYSIDADDPVKWKFIGPLINPGDNNRVLRWSGDMGMNWECTNFICNLKDETDTRREQDFLIMGTEGSEENDVPNAINDSNPSRPYRNQLWAAVIPRKDPSGQPTLTVNYSGHLDHGCFYAANSFSDPSSQRQVFYGWITEDDLGDELRHAQGWSGMLSLPRELRIQTLQKVIGASASDLSAISSIDLEPDDYDSYTVRTLASQPCPSVVRALRQGSGVRWKCLHRHRLGQITPVRFAAEDILSSQWELSCSFQVSKSCRSVGICIQHREDPLCSITLLFSPQSETFTVHRPTLRSSWSSKLINSNADYAPHTLFSMRDPHTGKESMETLDIRVWRDKSVLEIFVNDRTVISTRVYVAQEACGIHFFAHDGGDYSFGETGQAVSDTELLYASLWDGLCIDP